MKVVIEYTPLVKHIKMCEHRQIFRFLFLSRDVIATGCWHLVEAKLCNYNCFFLVPFSRPQDIFNSYYNYLLICQRLCGLMAPGVPVNTSTWMMGVSSNLSGGNC